VATENPKLLFFYGVYFAYQPDPHFLCPCLDPVQTLRQLKECKGLLVYR